MIFHAIAIVCIICCVFRKHMSHFFVSWNTLHSVNRLKIRALYMVINFATSDGVEQNGPSGTLEWLPFFGWNLTEKVKFVKSPLILHLLVAYDVCPICMLLKHENLYFAACVYSRRWFRKKKMISCTFQNLMLLYVKSLKPWISQAFSTSVKYNWTASFSL